MKLSKRKGLFSKKYSPFFKMVIQTLLLFIIITLPFSFNFTRTPPAYSMTNSDPSGLSYFNYLLLGEGYNTTRTILSTEPIRNLPESSILVISGGTKNYRDSEKAVINKFVSQGGILVLSVSEGPSYDLADYFGFSISLAPVMETISYDISPDVIYVHSPSNSNDTLCFVKPKSITVVSTSTYQEELDLDEPPYYLGPIFTQPTAFMDENFDNKWNTISERPRPHQIASVVRRGKGGIIMFTSGSFLTNDLYSHGFANINVTLNYVVYLREYLNYINNITMAGEKLVVFEESHKRWPFATTEGIINQTYGTLVILAKTRIFIAILILILLIFYYITPRFRNVYKARESYKKFLSNKIWSRRRELFDTFGYPIKPTEEERVLSFLYFQHELYPKKAHNYFLAEKLKYVPIKLFEEEERELFELALTRKLDHQTFLFLFKKLEEIQKRSRL